MLTRQHVFADVTFDNAIPDHYPHRQAVETVIVEALRGFAGPWRARVVCSTLDAWWVLTIRGPGFDWATMLWPNDQTPETISKRLKEALRLAELGRAAS